MRYKIQAERGDKVCATNSQGLELVNKIVPGHWICYPVDRRGQRLPRLCGRKAGEYDCHYVRAESQGDAEKEGAKWLRLFGFRFHAVDAVPYSATFRRSADGTLELYV